MSGDLRALAEAATPGPWIATGDDVGLTDVVTANDEEHVGMGYGGDAAYVAAANPAAILALLDERDALAAKVARVEALADEWADFDHDAVACPKFDCGDCTMLNAIFDIRAALRDRL